MTLTIVGLGPGDPAYLTLEAKAVLDRAEVIYLRTARHPAVSILPPEKLRSFNHLSREAARPDAVSEAIVAALQRLAAQAAAVVYAVPGHPLMGDATVRALLQQAPERGYDIRIVGGLSFIEPVITLLGLDPLTQGLQIVDAFDPGVEPQRPALIAHLDSEQVAAGVKHRLLERYPQEWRVTVVTGAGTSAPVTREAELATLERHGPFDSTTCLYVPALSLLEDQRSFAGLQAIVARLRHPELGCPWDRQQTHESLKGGFLQEAYEVVAALDEGDIAKLREELGDVLLHVVMQTQIAQEQGEFTMPELLLGLTSKLIRRHPHVFGGATVGGAEEVVANWDAIKRAERGEHESVLGSVVPNLPALAYSQELLSRAARSGFEWPSAEDALTKLSEELRELARAATIEARRQEFGDLLLALVNVARGLKIDAEEALRLAARRFYRRFIRMEEIARTQGRVYSALSLEEKLALWQAAKRAEGSSL